MTTDSYTRDRSSTRDARARPIGPGFFLILIFSVASTAAILISALVYWSDAPVRIASSYKVIADPANRAVAAELTDYNKNRTRNLAAARSDLTSVMKTISSVDDQLKLVTFPTAAQNDSGAITQADQKLTDLIGQQVKAPTLTSMQSFDPGVAAAAAAVKTQVRAIRLDLGLPSSSGPLY